MSARFGLLLCQVVVCSLFAPEGLGQGTDPQPQTGIRLFPNEVKTPIVPDTPLPDGTPLGHLSYYFQSDWMSGPIELRYPETMRSSMGFHFNDHYLSTVKPLHYWSRFPEWKSSNEGKTLGYHHQTQEGLVLDATASAGLDEITLEYKATNLTGQTLSHLEPNCCLKLGSCPEFNARWDLNHLFMVLNGKFQSLSHTTPTPKEIGREPWLLILPKERAHEFTGPKISPTWWLVDQQSDLNLMAATTLDHKYLIGYTWSQTPAHLMSNCGNPCLHTGMAPSPEIPHGESFTWHGKIYLLPNNPEELLQRYQRDHDCWNQSH